MAYLALKNIGYDIIVKTLIEVGDNRSYSTLASLTFRVLLKAPPLWKIHRPGALNGTFTVCLSRVTEKYFWSSVP